MAKGPGPAFPYFVLVGIVYMVSYAIQRYATPHADKATQLRATNYTNTITSILLVQGFVVNAGIAKQAWVRYFSYTLAGIFALTALFSVVAAADPTALDKAFGA